MMRYLLLIIIIVLAATPFEGAAVQVYQPLSGDPVLEPWRWQAVKELEGLNVLAMAEAPDGSMWFGCLDSIAHYDGLKLELIPFDEVLLKDASTANLYLESMSLIVLENGTPMVAFCGHLVRWDGSLWHSMDDILQTTREKSMRLLKAQDGAAWLLTRNSLIRFSENLSEIVWVLSSEKKGRWIAFCQDAEGTLWLLKKNRTAELMKIPFIDGFPADQLEWDLYSAPQLNDKDKVVLAAAPDGNIWQIADADTVLHCFDSQQEQWIAGRDTGYKKNKSLLVDRGGRLWIGGKAGVFSLDGKKWSFYTDIPLMGKPYITEMLEANDERMWIRDRSGRVYLFDRSHRRWQTYSGLHFQCETQEGVQWFLTDKKRVVAHHAGEWLKYAPKDGILDDPIMISESSHGIVFMSGRKNREAGIAYFDGSSWNDISHPEFALNINAGGMYEMADGTIWFGADGGRAERRKKGGVLQYEVTATGVPQLRKHHTLIEPFSIQSIAQTPDGMIWMGEMGLYRYSLATEKSRLVKAIPSRTQITDLATTKTGTLWVATNGRGIFQKRSDGWRQHTLESGLSSATILDLLPVQDGSLFAASAKGIDRFDGQGWTTRVFSGDFSHTEQSCSLRQGAGDSLWLNIGDIDSDSAEDASFYTVRASRDFVTPETEIRYYSERIAPPGNSHISWAGIDGWNDTPLDELFFSWRLDNGDWSPFNQKREQIFLELPSGIHTFDVRARDRDFNVDPTPAHIEFSVVAPVWQQGWFITMVLLFVGSIASLLWILIRGRELRLMERQRYLVELDRLKTGFFTNISHELRTPMTVVSGRLESLLNTDIDIATKHSLSVVLRNAQRVSLLITQLLDFRKIEERKMTVDTSPGDLVTMLREWVTSMQVLAEQKNAVCQFDSLPACQGWFDFDKLQKICINLISNAIKYTESGGVVKVSLGIEEYEVLIRVEDNGVGIGEKDLPHIFDRFYRVSEQSMAVGAGIGLNLVKELVDLLGGKIRAESPIYSDAERPGARFTVRLPFELVQGSIEKEESVMPLDPSAVTPVGADSSESMMEENEELPLILVVEDDKDIRDFIVEGLVTRYRVDVSENGQEGLNKAKKKVPDLIITDLMMPVMDGVIMCRELKTTMETSHIPVVMLTAKSSHEHQKEGLQTGADDYITKPFHMDLLMLRLANLLKSRRLLREKYSNDVSCIIPSSAENSQDKAFLEVVMRVIEEQYTDPEFNPDQFAVAVNMSRSSLQRKLKAVTDRTVTAFIQEFRINRATERLLNTSETIAEISFQVGCDEPSNFTRLFKKYYNVTPTKYRAEKRAS